MWRASWLVLFALILSVCTGCSLIGVGIGSAIPKKSTYGESEPAGPALQRAVERESLTPGDEVIVEMKPESRPIGPPAPPQESAKPPEITGRFRAIDGESLLLAGEHTTETQRVPLPLVDVAHVKHSSYWSAGLAIGALFDSIWISTTIIIVTSLGNLN
ncbi:MAG: hypothetical protein JST00_31535 [Deltaproteobacteria bacterium]|nr:hypothetical protein [Deltaproteobacteria bacterium]